MSQQPHKTPDSNTYTISFMVILSVVCALLLSVLASALAVPKERAKELDRTEQMMIAAKILDSGGFFLLHTEKGEYVPAKFSKGGVLLPGTTADRATEEQILEVAKRRFSAFLVDNEGKPTTFQKAGLNEETYISENQKNGYATLPLKLVYKILPNKQEENKESAEGYILPVNGFGLWDAIFGYLAIDPDGDTVIGITWYDQKETPGLGANISEADWQSQFPGKVIFQQGTDGKTDFATAPLGITVVKGKVAEVYGDSPRAKSAVDGMAGATLTGNGVTIAYKKSIAPYRPFLIDLQKKSEQTKSEG